MEDDIRRAVAQMLGVPEEVIEVVGVPIGHEAPKECISCGTDKELTPIVCPDCNGVHGYVCSRCAHNDDMRRVM